MVIASFSNVLSITNSIILFCLSINANIAKSNPPTTGEGIQYLDKSLSSLLNIHLATVV